MHGYVRGRIDKTLFLKDNGNLLIAQIYVNDIVLEGMSRNMVDHFVKEMQVEYKMSMVGELSYFLGFQVKQTKNDIFIPKANILRTL